METELTIQQRYELLDKLSKAVAVITEELKATKTQLSDTSAIVSSYTVLWGESIKNYEELRHNVNTSVEALKKQVDEYKEETDRFKQYSKGIDENLETRFVNFKERFENLNRTLEILEKGIKGIREIDLDRINEKIKDIPNLEAVRKELSNSTSPLVTKSDFNALEKKVSNIEGSVNSHFRNNFIALFFALTTIIGANIVTYYTFISKMDAMRATSTSQSSSAVANTVTPVPSKPNP